MITLRRLLRLGSAFTLIFAGHVLSIAEAKDTGPMSATDLEKKLAGKTIYNFVFVSATEVIDTDGHHFPPADIKVYLRKTKPEKNGACMVWLPKDQSPKIAMDLIHGLGEYGITLIVVRTTNPEAPGIPSTSGSGKKNLMLVGSPNPKATAAGERAPDLAGRPAELRPGKLPGRVRYVFKPDADVVAAAAGVTRLLLDQAAPPPPAPTDTSLLMVAPGAWKLIDGSAKLKDSRHFTSRIELSHRVANLEGGLVTAPAQKAIVVAALRGLIASDGGGTLRALRSDEMDFWWTYIGWDIEEPVFIIATKGGAFRFVARWDKDGLGNIDELNSLPIR